MKLSIITINRNNIEGLLKTIESVIFQTFTDFEYIVIDGASTDGSIDVIKEYTDHITYWISEPDTGIYNAMNKGILQASGEYIQFLNSGDTLSNNTALERIFNSSLNMPIASGKMKKIYPDGKFEIDNGQLYNRLQQNQQLTLYDFFIGTLNHSCSFIRKDLFKKYGLYDEKFKIVSDWAFFANVIGIQGEQVQFLDLIVTNFDMSGISNSETDKLLTERKLAFEELVPKNILDDYKFFHETHCSYIALKEKYDYLFHYRFTRVVTKLINKSLHLLDIRKKNK